MSAPAFANLSSPERSAQPSRAVRPAGRGNPTIIILVGESAAKAGGLAAGFQRRGLQIYGSAWQEAIPADAVPAVREVLSLLHDQHGDFGEITTVALADGTVSPSAEMEPLVIQELTIDVSRREVRSAGSVCELTKSEFDLLLVLAERPGVVFSRRQLVWAYRGANYPVDDRSIDVQMFNLRRKLGPSGCRVQTVRGVGYRLDAELQSQFSIE